MDPIPLVSEQIDDGAQLIARLAEEGVPVTAAAWVKESDGGSWYLYLVAPIMDRRGPREGYRRVLALIRETQAFRIEPFKVKLIGPTDQVAKALAAIRDRSAATGALWYNGGSLGMMPVDLAYLYPPFKVPSSSNAPTGAE